MNYANAQNLANSLRDAGREDLGNQIMSEVLMQQTIDCGVTLKKAKLMKKEYARAISWLDSEMKTADTEKLAKLQGAKANVQKASDDIDSDLLVLKNKMNELGYLIVYQVADVISEF